MSVIWSAEGLEARDKVVSNVQSAITVRAKELAQAAGRDRIQKEDVEAARDQLLTGFLK